MAVSDVKTIAIFGDSHAGFGFRGMPEANIYSSPSITMYRVGRDKTAYVHFYGDHALIDTTPMKAVIFCYGEVDCRCHVHRQIHLNPDAISDHRPGDALTVIRPLVTKYLDAIQETQKCRVIVICAAPPPTHKAKFEGVHGPITHDFPFIGTDPERAQYTAILNEELESQSRSRGFVFCDPFVDFRLADGMMDFERTDRNVHVGDPAPCIKRLRDCLAPIAFDS